LLLELLRRGADLRGLVAQARAEPAFDLRDADALGGGVGFDLVALDGADRMSKAALNAAGVSLAHDLRPRGVAVAILHPGYVRTGMTGGHGTMEPSESARLLWQRLDQLTLEISGGFWHADGERLAW
jgi:NAD(P)-dependent dehydrogenase (short-subunit alcohol dehydrogenase family)